MDAVTPSRKVRVGVVGVGNCASSLIQGLSFYSDARANEPVPGLMNVDLGGYHVGDVEISAAFDVHADKVGRDVAEAIYIQPNNTFRFANVKPMGVTVQRGPTLDGIGRYVQEDIHESDQAAVDITEHLVKTGTNVVVSYLP